VPRPATSSPGLLSAKEAAEFLQISVYTLYHRINQGDIKPVNPGAYGARFSKESLEALRGSIRQRRKAGESNTHGENEAAPAKKRKQLRTRKAYKPRTRSHVAWSDVSMRIPASEALALRLCMGALVLTLGAAIVVRFFNG
jgi:predicted DNA-binding transcriptional regulator AlpA